MSEYDDDDSKPKKAKPTQKSRKEAIERLKKRNAEALERAREQSLQRLRQLEENRFQSYQAELYKARLNYMSWFAVISAVFAGLSVLFLYEKSGFRQLVIDVFVEDGSFSFLRALLGLTLLFSLILYLYVASRRFQISVLSNEEISEKISPTDQEKISISGSILGQSFSFSRPAPKQVDAKDDYEITEFWDWEDALQSSKERLLSENKRLAARSSANLRNGIIISLVGITFIALTVFAPQLLPDFRYDPTDGKELTVLLQRLSLFLVIQVLAGFFLRLYVVTERGIERNIREITNLDFRIASGFMAGEDSDIISSLALKFAEEDRIRDDKKNTKANKKYS